MEVEFDSWATVWREGECRTGRQRTRHRAGADLEPGASFLIDLISCPLSSLLQVKDSSGTRRRLPRYERRFMHLD